MHYSLYTDGACSNNGRSNAKASWAFIIYNGHKLVHYDSGLVKNETTNNVGELEAILNGLSYVINNRLYPVKLYSDSEYSINSLTVWLYNQMKNGWKTAKGKPVKNKELIISIYKLLKDNNVKLYTGDKKPKSNQILIPIIHINSHVIGIKSHNNYRNDAVDMLAKSVL